MMVKWTRPDPLQVAGVLMFMTIATSVCPCLVGLIGDNDIHICNQDNTTVDNHDQHSVAASKAAICASCGTCSTGWYANMTPIMTAGRKLIPRLLGQLLVLLSR